MTDRPIYVSPSLLAFDVLNLGEEVRSIEEAGADALHIDVMDGHFVPNLSFGLPLVRGVKAFTRLPLDVHLMIANPCEMAGRYVEAGADWVSFHWEALPANGVSGLIDVLAERGAKVGIAINPDTRVEEIFSHLPRLNMITMMSVVPGFGGQAFMAEVLGKVAELRAHVDRSGLEVKIAIDGGINAETGKRAVSAGADVLVVGTYLAKVANRGKAIAELREQG